MMEAGGSTRGRPLVMLLVVVLVAVFTGWCRVRLMEGWRRYNSVDYEAMFGVASLDDASPRSDAARHDGRGAHRSGHPDHVVCPICAHGGDSRSAAGDEDAPGEEHEHHHHHHHHEHEMHASRNEAEIRSASLGARLVQALMGMRSIAALLLWLKMDEASHRNDWQLVNICLDAIMKIDPHFIEAFLLRAYVHVTEGCYDKAAEVLMEGLRHNKNGYALYFELGMHYYRRYKKRPSMPREALKWFKKAVSFEHPRYVERMYAYCLARAGRIREAERVLRRLAEDSEGSANDHRIERMQLDRLRKGLLPREIRSPF